MTYTDYMKLTSMLAKNLINRNKIDNTAKTDIKTLVLCCLYKMTSIDISSWSSGTP